ncbi:hypothetical protein MLD38_029820 [Melastoma candidum]|uniref:Uncharacterized protein n=1 Tax=Melastoma candidum TaxID=119954 RepID=A0ACB9N5A1_9MYRT|nr:hypothetical protein MLD38_029820 [Melastoma candidum]
MSSSSGYGGGGGGGDGNIRKERKRKSLRIAARKNRVILAGRMVGRENIVDYYEGPACRTRNRRKRKLGPFDEDPIAGDDDDMVSMVRLSEELTGVAGTMLPEKNVLELVLDILQRRDTYELFGEPAKEEEGCHEPVKEAMDFGTMRAKLHEGMYTDLDQFEGDVFLITENALKFNAKSTIYFRQARTIHELAKRVFRLLRSDPTGFESRAAQARHSFGWLEREIPKNRRIHSRRTPAGGSYTNIFTPFRSSGVTGHGSSSSKQRRRVRKSVLDGVEARDGRWPSSSEPDKRSRYKPWMAFINDRGPALNIFCDEIRPTLHLRQYEIEYRESLMRFCKDLGPTAQKVALRKLQALQYARPPSSSIALPSELPTCSHQIPEQPVQPFPCPLASEQPTAAVPISRPPIPASCPSRVTVLGLTNAKASSFNRDNSEKPSNISALRTDPLPLPVYQGGEIYLNRKAAASSEARPRLSVQANARPFSFDLSYLKAKLEEMNRNRQLPTAANTSRFVSFPPS